MKLPRFYNKPFFKETDTSLIYIHEINFKKWGYDFFYSLMKANYRP